MIIQSIRRALVAAPGSFSRRFCLSAIILLVTAHAAFAASPWEDAVDKLMESFRGPIARGLSLVAIVVGGLLWAYGEGDAKRMFAGIVFGVGMALGSVQFMAWLFP